LPKPNYAFEKRQRELAKKKKQEEKDARKREARSATSESETMPPAQPEPPTEAPEAATGPRVHLRTKTP
jgi:hypothetical protein